MTLPGRNHTPKLLLFDVDGTLIRSGGKGKNAMLAAVAQEYGHLPRRFTFKDFAGSTDPRIITTLLTQNGISQTVTAEDIARVLRRYLVCLQEEMAGGGVEVLPGVRELLNYARESGEFLLGLVTGNLAEGARIKLSPVGLYDYFAVGAYGSDEIDRNLLPPIAVRRAEARFQIRFAPENIWVIGDTPRDVECARVNRYRALAVATGGWPPDQLQESAPDALLPDLSDMEAVLRILRA